MNKKNYTPQPIDTVGVALPQELKALAEDIAKNVHEVWSAGRMKRRIVVCPEDMPLTTRRKQAVWDYE